MKQQLLVISRSRKRAPNLSVLDRFLLGFWSLFLSRHHFQRSAIILRPSTLLRFHETLKKRKYRLLYTPRQKGKPGPKGPSQELILLIVDRCDYLDQTLFWDVDDLERKLTDYKAYYNLHRTHRSLAGDTSAEVAGVVTKFPIKLNKFRWQSHCRRIYQLPIAA
ncbi:MAG: transposase [Gammaproteobacteria bacterium]|nr:transposase [Gammaproteobacteria bacterium]